MGSKSHKLVCRKFPLLGTSKTGLRTLLQALHEAGEEWYVRTGTWHQFGKVVLCAATSNSWALKVCSRSLYFNLCVHCCTWETSSQKVLMSWCSHCYGQGKCQWFGVLLKHSSHENTLIGNKSGNFYMTRKKKNAVYRCKIFFSCKSQVWNS